MSGFIGHMVGATSAITLSMLYGQLSGEVSRLSKPRPSPNARHWAALRKAEAELRRGD